MAKRNRAVSPVGCNDNKNESGSQKREGNTGAGGSGNQSTSKWVSGGFDLEEHIAALPQLGDTHLLNALSHSKTSKNVNSSSSSSSSNNNIKSNSKDSIHQNCKKINNNNNNQESIAKELKSNSTFSDEETSDNESSEKSKISISKNISRSNNNSNNIDERKSNTENTLLNNKKVEHQTTSRESRENRSRRLSGMRMEKDDVQMNKINENDKLNNITYMMKEKLLNMKNNQDLMTNSNSKTSLGSSESVSGSSGSVSGSSGSVSGPSGSVLGSSVSGPSDSVEMNGEVNDVQVKSGDQLGSPQSHNQGIECDGLAALAEVALQQARNSIS